MRALARYACLYAGILAYIYGGLAAASLFEDRPHPWSLWDGQYRALFPGDFGLALAFVAGYALARSVKVRPPRWWRTVSVFAGLAVGAVLFTYQISPQEYVEGVMFAPTRIWHQIFVWGLLSVVTLRHIAPGVWAAVMHPDHGHLRCLVFICLGLAVWVGCGFWDATRGNFLDPAYPIHAPWKAEYRPLWHSVEEWWGHIRP